MYVFIHRWSCLRATDLKADFFYNTTAQWDERNEFLWLHMLQQLVALSAQRICLN